MSLERFALAPDLSICRLLNGMWQVSGGHGRIDRTKALEYYGRFVDLWKDADAELQPRVADVRKRINQTAEELAKEKAGAAPTSDLKSVATNQ